MIEIMLKGTPFTHSFAYSEEQRLSVELLGKNSVFKILETSPGVLGEAGNSGGLGACF